jgi:DNA invertase Pin-like site-specific DNA recombinase
VVHLIETKGTRGMLIGYARTSTTEQEVGLEAQRRELKGYGCDEIFQEQVSSVSRREELERCLKFVRKGDSLVVTKLDRLARSIPDLVKIIGTLEEKGATLNILAMNLDTSSPTGRLLINLVGSIAQFEREIMLERQREGIAKAKGEGKYKGRAATARAKASDVEKLHKAGKGPSEIATQVGISRASVYRILAEA